MMKWAMIFFSVFSITVSPIHGQIISGRVINADSGEALIYVNIGILERDIGTITNEKGEFKLNTAGLSNDLQIRFSMIGFQSQIFTVGSIEDKMVVSLKESPVLLNAVEIHSKKQKNIQLGESTSTKKKLTGWGGYGVGAGGERGIKIQSNHFPIYPVEVRANIARNAYDSVLLRLHIRSIEDNIPAQEMLPENVFVTFAKPSGQISIDLTAYNLAIDKPFVVSLEWVKAWGKCSGGSCFLQFSVNSSKGTLYTREASDAKWQTFPNRCPAIFVNCNY